MRDQTSNPCCSSEPKITSRAASVPVGRRESSRLESLRSRKQKPSLLNVGDAPPTSTNLTQLAARGCKRASSSCATLRADCVTTTSISVTKRTTDADEQRPRKRHRRSISTPAIPGPSQPSAQLQSRRLSRLGADPPTISAVNVPRPRVSARLLRKIHPFIDGRSPDIYTHLAGPNGAGNLLSEPPDGSAILSTPNETVSSQSVKRPRGRRRNTVDLTDENAKRDLMEEWARIRRSQGALPLSGISENACFGQVPLHDNRKDDMSVPSVPLEAITFPDPTFTDISQAQETIPDVFPSGPSLPSTQIDFENALLMNTSASGGKPGDKDSGLASCGRTQLPIVPSINNEASSTSNRDFHMDEDSPSDELVGLPEAAHHNFLQRLRFTPPLLYTLSPQGDSDNTELSESLVNEQAEAMGPDIPSKDNHSVTCTHTYPISTGSIHLDSDEEFYMLDIPEIFSLPWVPISSHIYVPPSLGKLISGMRDQLTMEARARRRAEELYQAELSRRISAEKVIENLQTELGEKQTVLPGKSTC